MSKQCLVPDHKVKLLSLLTDSDNFPTKYSRVKVSRAKMSGLALKVVRAAITRITLWC